MRRSAILLLVLATASCDILGPKIDTRAALRNELHTREDLWHSRAVHSYDFTYQRSCFCAPRVTQPVTVQVRDDAIVHVLDPQGVDIPAQQDVSWPTVDSLFVWAFRLLEDERATIQVVFDPSYNFPSTIASDIPSIADEEVVHTSSNLLEFLSLRAALTSYRIGAPFSKSNRVTWRSR